MYFYTYNINVKIHNNSTIIRVIVVVKILFMNIGLYKYNVLKEYS